MRTKTPIALVILDGFGCRAEKKDNAIAQATTPCLDMLLHNYPWTLLQASGTAVGLPQGMIGNSEVGHLTMGAGRIVEQPLLRINRMIDDGTFLTDTTLIDSLQELKSSGGALHILGLLSSAGVHASEQQLYAYISAAAHVGIASIVIHPFIDGRDVAPQSAREHLERLEAFIAKIPGCVIGSIQGRWYAMDRDHNTDRTQKSYDMLTQKTAPTFPGWRAALDYYYAHGITDEFIVPTHLERAPLIVDGDAVIVTNFRPDRIRQLVEQFLNDTTLKLRWIMTPVSLFDHPTAARVLIDVPELKNTLKEVLSRVGKTVFSIAETEKYAHVTYFFGGGHESPFSGEHQELVPSNKHITYVDDPAMSAVEITQRVVASLEHDPRDFYLINYANADMVGHSGNLAATIRAVECLDAQLAILYQEFVIKRHGIMIVTGDHGKAEEIFDAASGQPLTAHTTNPVYFIVAADHEVPSLDDMKGLADVAPFILKQFVIPAPEENALSVS